MNKQELKKEFKKRWTELNTGKRLLAIELDGFTHRVIFDDEKPKSTHLSTYWHSESYSSCMSQTEANYYNMNSELTRKLFAGFSNASFQGKFVELVYIRPRG